MERAFYSVALLCLFYYGVILFYTKNKKATFSSFWLWMGVAQIALGLLAEKLPTWAIVIVQILSAVLLLAFLAVVMIIVSGMLVMPVKKLPVILVLGACIRGKQITGSLKRRLDKALLYLHDNPETLVIVSGGKGKGEEVTEAFAMQEYLLENGLPDERIVMEDRSRTTKENLLFSKELLKREEEKIGIVTNNFHLYRSLKLAKAVGYRKVYGISASCDPVLFFNYLVREFFAVLWMYVEFARESRVQSKKVEIDK